jgi:hypothetical protein
MSKFPLCERAGLVVGDDVVMARDVEDLFRRSPVVYGTFVAPDLAVGFAKHRAKFDTHVGRIVMIEPVEKLISAVKDLANTLRNPEGK